MRCVCSQMRANTRLALVPPKPKLFDITVSSFALRDSCRMGEPSTRGSSWLMWAEPTMNPLSSINRLKMA